MLLLNKTTLNTYTK